jgi:sulfate adenylyltransferase subunit 1
VIRLEDELDVSRGDMIVRSNNQPQVSQDIELILCWMDTQALNPQARYLLRHTTSEAQLVIKDILYKFDINTLGKIKKFESIELNDFAKIKIRVSKPLIYDKYKINKTTGGVIFINEQTGATCAAGMII